METVAETSETTPNTPLPTLCPHLMPDFLSKRYSCVLASLVSSHFNRQLFSSTHLPLDEGSGGPGGSGRAQRWLYEVMPGLQELNAPLCLVPRKRRAKALVTVSHSVELMTHFLKNLSDFKIHASYIELC